MKDEGTAGRLLKLYFVYKIRIKTNLVQGVNLMGGRVVLLCKDVLMAGHILNTPIDIGIFGAPVNKNNMGKPLLLQRIKHTKKENEFTFRLKSKPYQAGIDPYNYLIDRNPEAPMNCFARIAAGQDSIRREVDSIGLKKYVDKNFAKYSWATKLLL